MILGVYLNNGETGDKPHLGGLGVSFFLKKMAMLCSGVKIMCWVSPFLFKQSYGINGWPPLSATSHHIGCNHLHVQIPIGHLKTASGDRILKTTTLFWLWEKYNTSSRSVSSGQQKHCSPLKKNAVRKLALVIISFEYTLSGRAISLSIARLENVRGASPGGYDKHFWPPAYAASTPHLSRRQGTPEIEVTQSATNKAP